MVRQRRQRVVLMVVRRRRFGCVVGAPIAIALVLAVLFATRVTALQKTRSSLQRVYSGTPASGLPLIPIWSPPCPPWRSRLYFRKIWLPRKIIQLFLQLLLLWRRFHRHTVRRIPLATRFSVSLTNVLLCAAVPDTAAPGDVAATPVPMDSPAYGGWL